MFQTEKSPFVTCNTKNRGSQLSVSIFVTCLNRIYDIHAFIAKEVLVSLSNELLRKLFNCLGQPLADPGFGQGGAQNFFRDFADVAKRANIGGGPGPALGPWKLLHF